MSLSYSGALTYARGTFRESSSSGSGLSSALERRMQLCIAVGSRRWVGVLVASYRPALKKSPVSSRRCRQEAITHAESKLYDTSASPS